MRGFTLIAVMSILAILSVAVAPQLLDLRTEAKNANRITDAAAMAAAIWLRRRLLAVAGVVSDTGPWRTALYASLLLP